MIPQYHSTLFTVVTKTGPGEFTARSNLLATGWEAAASIRCLAATSAILEARWDICRSSGGVHNGGRAVPALRGVVAGLGAGPALRAAARDEGDLPYRLLAECVKSVVQAETYLFRERGFADAAAYESHWKKNYTGSCRRYGDRSYSGRSWCEHIADRAWGDLLFTRGKTAAVTAGEGDSLDIAGSFTDSFHDLGARLAVAAGVVTAAQGAFRRAPDDICPEAVAALATLAGRPLADLDGKALARQLGGPAGCSHMVDLVGYMVHTVHLSLQGQYA